MTHEPGSFDVSAAALRLMRELGIDPDEPGLTPEEADKRCHAYLRFRDLMRQARELAESNRRMAASGAVAAVAKGVAGEEAKP